MGQTIIEKILSSHAGRPAKPGEIVDVRIDARLARDFGGASVVKNLREHDLAIDDAGRTFFTFDCNPGGSDQKYAANQHLCRLFARDEGLPVYDVDAGIGTHIAVEEGLVMPGGTLVSTDSHANILGAVGAFGQGMGDQDIAAAWARGRVWFKVPRSLRVTLHGTPPATTTAKDIGLKLLHVFGASGLLGLSAELYGSAVEALGLSARMTIASLATEMGGIIIIFPPNRAVLDHFGQFEKEFHPAYADAPAVYERTVEVDVSGLEPLISRPGHPEDVVPVAEVAGTKVDSAFVGSCTNGRYEDMLAAAEILKGRRVAPGVVLKIVPATRRVWERSLKDGLLDIFLQAGALVGNPGCAGCAEGQIGQNGPGEVTVSTGNRNFAGKQGKGSVYLASPATAAASAVAGVITSASRIPEKPVLFTAPERKAGGPAAHITKAAPKAARPTVIRGRVWVIDRNNIDTDMIFHNRYLTVTDIAQMGRYTFDNLAGWEDFAKKSAPGDIVVTGSNFGAGSSRQQAVDCFKSLGVAAIIARSFGAIYERNAINAGLPVLTGDLIAAGLKSGEQITVDFGSG
ncbi:MAG: aconitase/3-isopropylmalate dehydratase large subunit family protein, partial [Candidatus Aminicenantes bacterium]|nr:aconitase/3-isopropylmalate dehydratase large subunit family protein [Candidatus Aminicenantes bacterium]